MMQRLYVGQIIFHKRRSSGAEGFGRRLAVALMNPTSLPWTGICSCAFKTPEEYSNGCHVTWLPFAFTPSKRHRLKFLIWANKSRIAYEPAILGRKSHSKK